MKQMSVEIRRKDDTKLIYFSLLYPGGTITETAENAGITHLLEHCLLYRDRLTNLKTLFDRDGVMIHGMTSREYICFNGFFLKQKLDFYIEKILGEINEKVEMHTVERNRRIVLKELAQYKRLKPSENVFLDPVWAQDIIGTKKTIELITADAINAQKTSLFERCDGVLSLLGDVENADVAIKNVKNNKGSPAKKISKISRPEIKCRHYLQNIKPERVRGELCITMPLNVSGFHEDIPILSIANAMLTGITESVLNHKIRETDNLVYQIKSYPEIYCSVSLFHIKMITEQSNVGRILEETNRAIEEICASTNSTIRNLFEYAKRKVLMENLLILENNPLKVVTQISLAKMFGFPEYAEVGERIEKTDFEEFQQRAKTLFCNKEKKYVTFQ